MDSKPLLSDFETQIKYYQVSNFFDTCLLATLFICWLVFICLSALLSTVRISFHPCICPSVCQSVSTFSVRPFVSQFVVHPLVNSLSVRPSVRKAGRLSVRAVCLSACLSVALVFSFLCLALSTQLYFYFPAVFLCIPTPRLFRFRNWRLWLKNCPEVIPWDQ